MKKVKRYYERYLCIFILFFSVSQAALINLTPSYNDSAESLGSHCVGLNENLHILGFYTVKIPASSILDSFRKFETRKTSVYFHLGSTMIMFGGAGISLRRHLFNTKQQSLSPFLSYSISAAYILPFCAEGSDCDVVSFDAQSIVAGLDMKLIKYKRFTLGATLGLGYFFTIAMQRDGASPILYLSLSY